MKLLQYSGKSLIVFGAIVLNLVASVKSAQSQAGSPAMPPEPIPHASTNAGAPSQILFNAPPPPKQGTPSGRAQGGASRGPCQEYEDLAALVPTTEGVVWGRTTQSNPSLWFYLPHPLTAETPVEFAVQDSADNYVYQTSLSVPNAPSGLIRFDIEPDGQPLQPDQLYTWTLVIYCDPAQPTRSVFVNGTLEQSSPTPELQAQLARADALEQAKLYAANGIWYDALTVLAQQYQSQPSSDRLSTAWADLLQQAELDNLSSKPFSPCCNF
jgi:hypothetical protein